MQQAKKVTVGGTFEAVTPKSGYAWRRLVAGVSAAGAMLLGLAGPFGNTTMAQAANAASIRIDKVIDGIAPFDVGDDSPGHDSGDSNYRVRTNDTVEYRLAVTPQSGTDDTTFTVDLADGHADGMTLASSTAAAFKSASCNSAKLCTFTLAATGGTSEVQVGVMFTVSGVANNTVLAPTFVSGSVSATAPDVTVSAAPKFAITLRYRADGASAWTKLSNGQTGYFLYANVLVAAVLTDGSSKGIEPLKSPFTYHVEAPSADAVLASYGVGNSGSYVPSCNGTSVTNVTNCGAVEASQSSAGADAVVTVTGADTSAARWPTAYSQSGGNTSLPDGSEAIVSLAYIVWFIPDTSSDLPTSGTKTFYSKVTDFNPVSISGQANYDGAPGQGAAAADTLLAVSPWFTLASFGNTLAMNVTVDQQPLTWSTRVFQGSPALPNNLTVPGSSGLTGDTLFTFILNGPAPTQTNPTFCFLIYQGVAAFNSSGSFAYISSVAADWKIEYSAATTATGCGYVGDDKTGWASSPAGLGDAPVGYIRATYQSTIDVGDKPGIRIPLIIKSDAVGQTLRTGLIYVQSDQTAFRAVDYVNVNLVSVVLRHTVTWDVTGTDDPTAIRTVTVTPTAQGMAGTSAPNVTETITLPKYFTYQADSAQFGGVTLAPEAVQSTANSDGTTTLVLSLGDVPVGSTAVLTLNAQPDPMMPLPTNPPAQVTAVITCQGVNSVDTVLNRTATAGLNINAPITVVMAKIASSSVASPGVPFDYTLTWGNRTGNNLGAGWFVDVLPNNNDGRGTSGLDNLTLNAASISLVSGTADLTCTTYDGVQGVLNDIYDAADPNQPAADAWDSHSEVQWTACPTDSTTVTAIKISVNSPFKNGDSGSVKLTMTPGDLSRTGQIVNSFSGVVDGWNYPLQDAASVTMNSAVAMLHGNVFNDLNYSFDKDSSDTGVATPVVKITGGYAYGANGSQIPVTASTYVAAMTDETNVAKYLQEDDPDYTYQVGDYVFPSLAPGVYDITVTLPDSTQMAILPIQATNGSQPQPATNNIGLADGGLPTTAIGITLTASQVLGGVDFGVQKPLSLSASGDPVFGKANSQITGTTVLANDSYTTSDGLWVPPTPVVTAETVTTAQGGTAMIAADGTYTYTPPENYLGDDTFTYTVTDAQGHTASATVTVTLSADTPILSDATRSSSQQTVKAGDPVTFSHTLSVDEDASAQPGTCTISPAVAGATAVVDSTGIVTVTFSSATADTYSITLSCTDNLGTSSNTVTDTVIVAKALELTPSPEQPVVKAGDPATFDNVLTIDDTPNSGVTATCSVDPETVDGDTGTVVVDDNARLTVTSSEPGSYSFDVTCTDSLGQSATVTNTVVVAGALELTPSPDTLTVTADQTATFKNTLVSDPVAAPVTCAVSPTTVDGGTVDVTNAAQLTVTSSKAGSYSFKVTCTDALNQSAFVTNTVVVAEAPVLTSASPAEQTVLLSYLQGDTETGTEPGTVTFADSLKLDPAVAALGDATCQINVSPTTATVKVDNTTGQVTFTATENTAAGDYTISLSCTDAKGQTTATVTNTVRIVAPEITIDLSHALAAGATGAVGDTIVWTYTVENTGSADLSGIAIADLFTRPAITVGGISALDEPLNPLPAITCGGEENGTVSLKSGESITCTGVSIITQVDKDAGQIVNTAGVTGLAVTDSATEMATAVQSTNVVTLDRSPDVTVEKKARVTDNNFSGQVDLGDQIVFEITVTNTGDVTLRNVTVTDASMPQLALDCGDQTNGEIVLTIDAPGNVIVCTTSAYTITADDVAAGKVVNVATADGQYGPEPRDDGATRGVPGGDISSDLSEVTVSVTATQAPTGGWVAPSGSWQWAWFSGAGLLLAGAALLLRRRSQRQAGDAV